jgi:hypothetical protein
MKPAPPVTSSVFPDVGDSFINTSLVELKSPFKRAGRRADSK